MPTPTPKPESIRDPFTIRPLTAADLPAALEVYCLCEDFLALGPTAQASMDMVLQDIERSRAEGGLFCGIFSPAETLIGILDYIPYSFNGNPHHAFLSLLMIAPPSRSQGLGAAVVRWVEAEFARSPQVTAIFSAVQVNNPAAVRFWQRLGYAIVSEPELQADGTVTVRLHKGMSGKKSPQSSQSVL